MKNIFTKIKNFFVRHAPTKRRLIQVYSALLFNANLKGYISSSGGIFKGDTKNFCTPGLNCYSCPGAITSCPLGALQNAFASSGKSAPYYMLGIILLYCVMFGRWICGWLCPFGLVQDLLHKIRTPKVKKSRITKVLSVFKYILLVVFVVILPLIYVLRDIPLPAFCKYICPEGTFGGALGLLINPANDGFFSGLGPLFTWKFILMISFIVAAVFIYRVFCRFFCPLGAIYGLFNKIAIFGIKLEKKACVDCGKCVTACKLDIREVGDRECIQCGDCIAVCPTQAITWKGSKIFLPKNDFEKECSSVCSEDATNVITVNNNAVAENAAERFKKRSRITASVILASVLLAALVYFNIVDPLINKDERPDYSDFDDEGVDEELAKIPFGEEVGDRCPIMTLDLVDGSGSISISSLRGKVVVINFWGTWCGPCKAELPYFNRIASEYEGEVVVLTIHTAYNKTSKAEAPGYISEHFDGSKMLFAYDIPYDDYSDEYYTALGGLGGYPMTLVLDDRGVISFTKQNSMHYEELKDAVENALNK